jgi:hypothetical protein
MTDLTLAQAQTILAAALDHGRASNFQKLAIAVLDHVRCIAWPGNGPISSNRCIAPLVVRWFRSPAAC